jgi:hypothetical protein
MKSSTLLFMRFLAGLSERVVFQLLLYYMNWRAASALLEREY